jgi:hypothetical protein
MPAHHGAGDQAGPVDEAWSHDRYSVTDAPKLTG